MMSSIAVPSSAPLGHDANSGGIVAATSATGHVSHHGWGLFIRALQHGHDLRRQRWQPDVSGAGAWLAVASWPGADRLGVVIVIARSMPAEQAVGVKVALGLLNGHADDSRIRPTGQASVGFTQHAEVSSGPGCYSSPRWYMSPRVTA